MKRVDAYKQSRQLLFEQAGIRPKSKMVTTNGPVQHVHYLEMGEGIPLILVHGGGSHSSEWFNILKPLSQHFHLLVVDRPGCGLTDTFDYRGVDVRTHAAQFLRSFMDALCLQRASFLAQSMGGYFSICLAMENPERIDHLVAIGAPAGMNRWVPPMMRLLAMPGINTLLLKTVARPSIPNVVRIHREILMADVRRLSKIYYQHVYDSHLLPGNFRSFTTLLENVLTVSGWRQELYIGDKLDQVKARLHFIWGERDAFERPDSGMSKVKNIEGCEIRVIADAGHCPWLDKPEECSQAVISILKGARM